MSKNLKCASEGFISTLGTSSKYNPPELVLSHYRSMKNFTVVSDTMNFNITTPKYNQSALFRYATL